MKRSKETQPVHQFSATVRQGFCLGCGATIRLGERRKTFHWHQKCYLRFYRLWTKGLKYRRRRCPGCGKTFEAIGQGYNAKTCSRECHRLRRLKERWNQRREKGKPIAFSDHYSKGFCLGCGGKTRWVKGFRERTGKRGDSQNWHRACYESFYYRWTVGLDRSWGYKQTCIVCQRPFTAAGVGAWRKKICSEECRREYGPRYSEAWRKKHARRRSVPREERSCLICGKPFFVGGGHDRWRKKTCSRECRLARKRFTTAAWDKAHRIIRTLDYERICVVCGRAFRIVSPREWQKKTCSIPCRYEWSKQRSAAWEKAQPGRSSKDEGGKIEARKSSGSL